MLLGHHSSRRFNKSVDLRPLINIGSRVLLLKFDHQSPPLSVLCSAWIASLSILLHLSILWCAAYLYLHFLNHPVSIHCWAQHQVPNPPAVSDRIQCLLQIKASVCIGVESCTVQNFLVGFPSIIVICHWCILHCSSSVSDNSESHEMVMVLCQTWLCLQQLQLASPFSAMLPCPLWMTSLFPAVQGLTQNYFRNVSDFISNSTP